MKSTLELHADAIEDGDPPTITVPTKFMAAVAEMREAAKLVVKSEGAYDLEWLEETIEELDEN